MSAPRLAETSFAETHAAAGLTPQTEAPATHDRPADPGAGAARCPSCGQYVCLGGHAPTS
jgi:hypothetical protein